MRKKGKRERNRKRVGDRERERKRGGKSSQIASFSFKWHSLFTKAES